MKKAYIEMIKKIIKENLYRISELDVSNYNKFMEIRKINSFATKYYSKMKSAEVLKMLEELQNCLEIKAA